MMFEEYVAWQESKKRKVNRSEASKARARAYQKERRERLKALGLCTICGMPTNNGRVKCDRCLKRARVDTATSGMEYIEPQPQKVVMVPIKTLEQVAMEAKAAGMSYGQYVALTEVRRNG